MRAGCGSQSRESGSGKPSHVAQAAWRPAEGSQSTHGSFATSVGKQKTMDLAMIHAVRMVVLLVSQQLLHHQRLRVASAGFVGPEMPSPWLLERLYVFFASKRKCRSNLPHRPASLPRRLMKIQLIKRRIWEFLAACREFSGL